MYEKNYQDLDSVYEADSVKREKDILNDRTHPLPSYTHDIMSGAWWLRGDSGQKLENWKLENWKILDQLDSCTLFTPQILHNHCLGFLLVRP